MTSWKVIEGDCLDAMRAMPEASVDAIVTDPPYGLGFMGKQWDALPPGPEWAEECLRVLKPGAHLLAFGGTRTAHRLVCAIEDAGFEIRDTIAWLYGSGFPKSLDVSKAIDKAAGAEREVLRTEDRRSDYDGRDRSSVAVNTKWREAEGRSDTRDVSTRVVTAPATPDAERWQGWGTALKPAYEPIVVARKPLTGTVAANVLAHGTGALNIDACRIEGIDPANAKRLGRDYTSDDTNFGDVPMGQVTRARVGGSLEGRWPANVTLDEEAAAILDEQTGDLHSQDPATRKSSSKAIGVTQMGTGRSIEYADTGGASRFLYVAKPDQEERNVGLIGRNPHPTVKPVTLMRWLIRLVTPEGGTVLDPFTGSGTTGIAALREGLHFIGIEREAEYVQVARARIIGDAPLLNTVAEAA